MPGTSAVAFSWVAVSGAGLMMAAGSAHVIVGVVLDVVGTSTRTASATTVPLAASVSVTVSVVPSASMAVSVSHHRPS